MRDPAPLFDVASRQNPRRGFLLVSRCIGRNFPSRPQAMRQIMAKLAAMVTDLPQPVLFVGLAETAVVLGQGVHQAWTASTGGDALFLSTTRQVVDAAETLLRFKEPHSHATEHLILLPANPAVLERFYAARSAVVIDDEISTGVTIDGLSRALSEALPKLDQVCELVITDWSDEKHEYRRSLMSGSLEWDLCEKWATKVNNGPRPVDGLGWARPGASQARHGYITLRRDLSDLPNIAGKKRILVLADGENGYDALLIAETYEREGHTCFVQAITRSPALLGGIISTIHEFEDSHGSGAPCFAYNLFETEPDAIVCVVENRGSQLARLEAAACAAARTTRCFLVQIAE